VISPYLAGKVYGNYFLFTPARK